MSASDQARQHAQKIFVLAALKNEQRPLELCGMIVSSWQRCLEREELDPLHRHDVRVIETPLLNELQERFGGLLRVADPALSDLAKVFEGSDYAVILTDPRGVILRHIVEPGQEREFRRAGLYLGADWGESQVGTNGIGTCIVEERPVTVHKDEHFLSQNIHLTCSAAPILDPHGNLLAVLDTSCCRAAESRASQTHTRALVSTCARLIESQHFLHEFRNQRILLFQDRIDLVTLPDKALIALSGDNRVLAANNVAMRLLGIGNRKEIVGEELAEVIGKDVERLIRVGDPLCGAVVPFRNDRNGSPFFGLVHQYRKPRRREGLTVRPSESDPDSCRGQLCELGVLAGRDPQMQIAAGRARKVVDKRIPILILGETGTGKDLFAQAVHKVSTRKDEPFVALNCAAIPESLIESELFGYRHGAFTGANRAGRRGKIIESSGGTLFLDEIGDMPLNMQCRLLRVLETQEVVPLGSEDAVQVKLNIIAASHRALTKMVAERQFREDLYYRLNGVTLNLPPLRGRHDLSEIVMKVLEAENDTGKELRVSPKAMATLLRYPWPGNLRQLRYVVRTAIALCEGDIVDVADINLPSTPDWPAEPAATAANEPDDPTPVVADTAEVNPLTSAEHQVILASLEAHSQNISRTAEALGMSRNTLYRKMRKHEISPDRR